MLNLTDSDVENVWLQVQNLSQWTHIYGYASAKGDGDLKLKARDVIRDCRKALAALGIKAPQ